MGLKELKAAGGRAEQLMAFGLEINRVENIWGPKFDALRTQAGKPLAELSDAEVTSLLFSGVTVSAGTVGNAKKVLTAAENMITGIRQIKDTLPANDLE